MPRAGKNFLPAASVFFIDKRRKMEYDSTINKRLFFAAAKELHAQKEGIMEEKIYACIDMKSFFASVECAERGLNPMEAQLIVADESRGEGTICLAVSPSLKAYGIPGRARLFEVVQKVREVNRQRQRNAPNGILTGKSCFAP